MKLQKISDIRPTLGFTEFDFLEKYRASFATSELGRIYQKLPLKELAKKLASHNPRKHPQGNKPMFPPEGEVALMFLKPYTGLSDDGLIEVLNGSIHMQMFCGVLLLCLHHHYQCQLRCVSEIRRARLRVVTTSPALVWFRVAFSERCLIFCL